MEHFCWFIKLLFLLLMLLKVPSMETRAVRSYAQQTDIIAGNEFLKLFLERDEVQRDLHSSEYHGRGGGRGAVHYYNANNEDGQDSGHRMETEEIATISNARSRSTSSRSLDSKSRNANDQTRGGEDGKKSSQVVKLVTSGSKIVFIEDEYDEEDAVAGAVEIELKKERKPREKIASSEQQRYPTMSDEVKVVAVSVSSSSKRTHANRERSLPQVQTKNINSFPEAAAGDIQEQHHNKSLNSDKITSSTSQSLAVKKLTTTTSSPATITSTSTTTTAPATLDFINRSHKSEFLIEEAEPLTMLKNVPSFPTSTHHLFYDTDSENSASTNIRNVLAVPASDTDSLSNGSGRNISRINQSPTRSRSYSHGETSTTSITTTISPPVLMEDKLLPFQTVIYHDTKEGHGPQSRSISYSSISQNVEDLQTWQKSGILAEAQRNVSESLKPLPRASPAEPQKHSHSSEPSKFYSLPAQMYSVPAKFYSEPAKVYSEPSKVYGQPEKVYSEPAKVYSQPAKFYSEPSKVYSQPAKVYSEPAKTYWPRPLPAATTSTTTAATISSTAVLITTTPTPFAISSSRRPAIVSRIAFGEAQTTQVPTDTGQQHPTQTNRQYHNQHSQNIHHHQQQEQQHYHQQHQHHHHHHHHHHASHASHADNANSQPRRVLFNLDRLPYDLLNAPEQTPDHQIPPSAAATTAAAGNSYNVGRQRPCWEPPTSSTSSQQHQPQHSSLLDQHSNQNAKGLPNRDLVKCVSKYSHSSAASLAKRPNAYTTERSHIEELYTPTPEQNYEIEESVSVMTNGRAHGVQVFGGPTTATTTTRSHMRSGGSSGDSGRPSGVHHGALYNSNANANVDDAEQATDENYDEDQNDNNNNNEGTVDADDADANGSGNSKNNNNGKDDSKVAYVLEGRNFRKYRVEEKTDDGFIVGEYGVVDHQDGNLRGVRYTADSTINRSLIQKALLTFLKLK